MPKHLECPLVARNGINWVDSIHALKEMGQTKDSKWLKAVRFQRKPPEFLNQVTFDAIKTTFTDIFQQSCRAILQTLLAVSQIVNSHFAFTSRDFGRCHDSVCLSLCLHGFTAATPNSSHISQALSKLSTLNCLYAWIAVSLRPYTKLSLPDSWRGFQLPQRPWVQDQQW